MQANTLSARFFGRLSRCEQPPNDMTTNKFSPRVGCRTAANLALVHLLTRLHKQHAPVLRRLQRVARHLRAARSDDAGMGAKCGVCKVAAQL